MNFLEKLNYMLEKENLNRNSLSKQSGIPYTTIDGWYKKGYDEMRLSTLKKLANFFNTDLEFWVENNNTSSVLMNESDIVGKYTAVNATIPEGSMFYSDVLVNFEDLPGTWLKKIKTDVNGVIDIPYYLSVNMVTSFGNAIQPDTYIDIYKDESELVIWGKLIDNVQVLAVKDMSGEDVFKDVSSDAVPAYLYFGVPAELHDLLRKALYLQPKGVEIVVVPHGGANPVTGDVEIRSAYLRDYIDALSAVVPTDEEYVTTLDGNTPNTNTNTNTNQ